MKWRFHGGREVNGFTCESHIMKDAVGFVAKFFPVKRSRIRRATAPLSMGGHGVLELALEYPNVFGSAAAHSGACLWGRRSPEGDFTDELVRIHGADPEG